MTPPSTPQCRDEIMRAVRARGLLHELTAERGWPWADLADRQGPETFGVGRVKDGLPAIYLPATPGFAAAASRLLHLAGVDHYLGQLKTRGTDHAVTWELIRGA
jgi:hypothetical protein